jgi:GntR family transcriptional regulator/MocR family aminotransferase
MASSDANGMVEYLGKFDNLISKFSDRISAQKNLISEAKNYLQMLDRQGDLNTRTNAIRIDL